MLDEYGAEKLWKARMERMGERKLISHYEMELELIEQGHTIERFKRANIQKDLDLGRYELIINAQRATIKHLTERVELLEMAIDGLKARSAK